MSKTTANFGLIKPELTDSADITQMNQNWDTIDAQLKTVDDRVTTVDNKFKNYATTKDVDDAIEQINEQLEGLSTDAGDLTGVLPIEHGGTGANTVEGVQSKFGIVPMSDIPNLHIWKKYSGEPNKYTEQNVSNVNISLDRGNGTFLTIDYGDRVIVVDNTIALVGNVTTVSIKNTGNPNDDCATLKGKYIHENVSGTISNNYYFIPSNATFTLDSNNRLYVNNAVKIAVNASSGSLLGYAASNGKNTYPTNGQHSDGYWYVYSKKMGDSGYTYSPADLTAGTSALETGKLYFVYE